ncbi:MAG TPA: hypothetical protein VE860_12965, partial [Chthoniobacterales bacterium]|nr:hypothetical protein [Chthoniobacterales bacterium]
FGSGAGSLAANAQSSFVEAKLWACFSTIRHLKARVFLRPGPTGEQVKTVANALGADLIVTSSDYHHRFLSYLTHADKGNERRRHSLTTYDDELEQP